MLSSVGRVRLPRSISNNIKEIRGHTPVLPPMGVSITYGTGLGPHGLATTFNIHSSGALLTEKKTNWLFERFFFWMDELGKKGGQLDV